MSQALQVTADDTTQQPHVNIEDSLLEADDAHQSNHQQHDDKLALHEDVLKEHQQEGNNGEQSPPEQQNKPVAHERQQWNSRLGFLCASIGATIGTFYCEGFSTSNLIFLIFHVARFW